MVNARIFIFFLISFLATVCPAQDLQITHGPFLQAVTETEVTVIWTTSKPATSWVELADGDTKSFYEKEQRRVYEMIDGIRHTGTLHRIRIRDLSPGMTYQYRICSQAVESDKPYDLSLGKVVATDVFRKAPLRFKTLNPQQATASVCIVNDIHGNNSKLEDLLANVKFENTDAVIFNGDMVDYIMDENTLFNGFLDKSTSLFASEVPIFYARGNHETRGPFRERFADYFPTPDNQLYYCYRIGPVLFISLDCGEDKADSDYSYFGMVKFEEYRLQQQEWLRELVQTQAFKDAPFKVVVLHIPPKGTWHGSIDLAEKFLPVLNHQGIDVMLCGHTHRYKYIPKEENPGADFPILINGAESLLQLKGNRQEMVIKLIDRKQNTVARHRFAK